MKFLLKACLVCFMFAQLVFSNELKMQIFKPVSSTCPQSWLDEMKKTVDEVEIISMYDIKGLKKNIGIPLEIQSCNTSIINDYVFEGNVPAKAIKNFFNNIPKDALGLSLPSYENDKEVKTVYLLFENNRFSEFGKY